MTDTSRAVVRYLGGETGHRSFFGGTHSRTRVVMLALFIAAGIVLTPLVGWPGLAVGAVGCGITLAVTAKTHRGSVIERRRKSRRWRRRSRSGTLAFAPYSDEAWKDARDDLKAARRSHRRGRKAGIVRARRRLTSLRVYPDGADGMGWLQHGRGRPGIAWHAPAGEDDYLSVAFSVSGQLRGIESTAVMTRAAEGWGHFLAGRAPHSSLVGNVQTVTRVLPADSALQQYWVLNSLDPDAPADAVASYDEVLRLTGEDAMVQRHFITVSWPITPAFTDAASKFGEGRDGWRRLMTHEIDATVRGLTEARLGRVEALTARQTTAVILHQQDPSRPIDEVADVDPASLGVASRDEYSAHVVAGGAAADARPAADSRPAAGDGDAGQSNPAQSDPAQSDAGQSDAGQSDPAAPVEWWHRTAAITADALVTAPRTQLWVLDLLIGNDLSFIRSVSFHIHLVPAAEAKIAARQDVVRDAAETLARREAGKISADDTEAAMSAANRRRSDLVSGSHHHGAAWVGYVTISAHDRDELARASRQLEDTCSTSLGIERLDWLDSYQSAASGTTWPIGRGIGRSRTSISSRVYSRLAGKSEKGAIS